MKRLKRYNKAISFLLCILLIFTIFPATGYATSAIETDSSSVKDIFVNVNSDVSGYSATDLANEIVTQYTSLGGLASDLRIKTGNTQIDTTNLSGWQVYDHYDTAYWDAISPSTTAQEAYTAAVTQSQDQGGYGTTIANRPYYGMTENSVNYGVPTTISNIGTGSYTSGKTYYLKEHIYSYTSNGKPAMRFYGYSAPAHADFLYYPASSSGTKSVKFDVNATNVMPHSMKYAGYLVNAGVSGSSISGYLILLEYGPMGSSSAATSLIGVYLYKLTNATLETLHSGGLAALADSSTAGKALVATSPFNTFYAKSHFELEITSTKLVAKIQALDANGALTGSSTNIFNEDITNTGFGGFGPYVNYASHGCSDTSSFIYSNLEMSVGESASNSTSMLTPLQNADFLSDSGRQRYFINIIGASSSYNLDNDANYLTLLQNPSVSLITNATVASIQSYLPEFYYDGTNTSKVDLGTSIARYLYGINAATATSGAVSVTQPSIVVADFILKNGSSQVAKLNREYIGASGLELTIENRTTSPAGTNLTPTCTAIDPSGVETTISNNTITVGSTSTAGLYTIKMDYGTGNIPAFAYFRVRQDNLGPDSSLTLSGITSNVKITNSAVSGDDNYMSDLGEYALIKSSQTSQPSTVGVSRTSLAAGTTNVSDSLDAGGYYLHSFVWDGAGNVDYSGYIKVDNLVTPSGLTGISPTTAGGSDGQITGTVDGMEYKLSTSTTWSAITQTSISDLPAGTYHVRYASSAAFSVGPSAEVVLSEGQPVAHRSSTTNPNTATTTINGQSVNIGTKASETNQEGQTQTVINVNPSTVGNLVNTMQPGSNLVIPITNTTTLANTESSQVRMNVGMMEEIFDKQVSLTVDTGQVEYTLPPAAINLPALVTEFGPSVQPSEIEFNITIANVPDPMVRIVQNTATRDEFSVMVPPIEFNVTAIYNNQTINVNQFSSHVTRQVAIPAGVDPTKITTAIVVKDDGTTYHVPTDVNQINNQWYAKISSLTNSVYTLIYKDANFSDTIGEWFEAPVAEAASRTILNGYADGTFRGTNPITRAEFAAMIVNTLGLDRVGTSSYSDVGQERWFYGVVSRASEYKVVTGRIDGTFDPTAYITRQEAMIMMQRAAEICGLEASQEDLTNAFQDSWNISTWSKDAVNFSLNSGLVKGNDENLLRPRANITRAEASVMILRLLQKSELIDIRTSL